MSQGSESNKVFVVEGCMIGRLAVGPLVFNVREHPLYVETPVSYVKQGRLRECTCTCGNVRLVAEKILERGRVLSCGCLKRERGLKAQLKISTQKLSAEARKQLTLEIRSEQKRLQYYLAQDPKDENKITQISERIKVLMAQKLSTINFKRNAQDRIRRKEAKLIAEAEAYINQNHVP